MNKEELIREYRIKIQVLENINDKLSSALISAEIKLEKLNKAREYIKKEIKDDYYCRKSEYLINNLLSILGDKDERDKI